MSLANKTNFGWILEHKTRKNVWLVVQTWKTEIDLVSGQIRANSFLRKTQNTAKLKQFPFFGRFSHN